MRTIWDQELADTREAERLRREKTERGYVQTQGTKKAADVEACTETLDPGATVGAALEREVRRADPAGRRDRIAAAIARAEFASDYQREWHLEVVMRLLFTAGVRVC